MLQENVVITGPACPDACACLLCDWLHNCPIEEQPEIDWDMLAEADLELTLAGMQFPS